MFVFAVQTRQDAEWGSGYGRSDMSRIEPAKPRSQTLAIMDYPVVLVFTSWLEK